MSITVKVEVLAEKSQAIVNVYEGGGLLMGALLKERAPDNPYAEVLYHAALRISELERERDGQNEAIEQRDSLMGLYHKWRTCNLSSRALVHEMQEVFRNSARAERFRLEAK